MISQTIKTPLPYIPPIDDQGIPTTYLSFLILDLMFSERNRCFTSNQLAKFFAARPSDVHKICTGLEHTGFLTADTSAPITYKYNLNCNNTERQAKLEKFLLEVELENLPVISILPFSPSYP